MYLKPTKEMILEGIECGWPREMSERGYAICDFDGTGLLEIERIDDVFLSAEDEKYFDVMDEDCAIEAERSGFCKIIPVEELPSPMMYDGSDRRYFGWVDTPENRERISNFFKSK